MTAGRKKSASEAGMALPGRTTFLFAANAPSPRPPFEGGRTIPFRAGWLRTPVRQFCCLGPPLFSRASQAIAAKAAMSFKINRQENCVLIPKANREHVLSRIRGVEVTQPGWEYANDNVWNQEDESIFAGARQRFRAGQEAPGKATMCPEINRYENGAPVPKGEPSTDLP
jgi:hypothetical protein